MRRDADAEPVSEHGDAEAATQAAVQHAGAEGAARVLMHDLYSRVHAVRPSRTSDSRIDR